MKKIIRFIIFTVALVISGIIHPSTSFTLLMYAPVILKDTRKQFNDIVIGTNGTGKTSYIIEIVIRLLEYFPDKRCLFVVPDDMEEKLMEIEEIEVDQLTTFTGIKKIVVTDVDFFDVLYTEYVEKQKRFNGIIVWDDMGVILNRRQENLGKLFKRRRQINLDQIWSFHDLHADVPKQFFGFVNRIHLFRTTAEHESFAKNINAAKRKEFEQMYFRVQAKSEKEPQYMEEFLLNRIS